MTQNPMEKFDELTPRQKAALSHYLQEVEHAVLALVQISFLIANGVPLQDEEETDATTR